MTLRDRILVQALAAIGLGADPVHLAAFAAFLGGESERPEMSHAMAADPRSSTCGLTCRAILRGAGVDDPRLRAPYRIGMAIADLLALASERGALVHPTVHGDLPCAGDIVGVALDGPDAGTHGHVYTVVTEPVVGENGAVSFDSVDGGQVDGAGRQCVRRKSRTWYPRPGGGWDDSTAGSRVRTVSRWIDVGRLDADPKAEAAQ